MTKAEAAELQVRWTQQMDSPLCVHRKIDLERSEDGYMTGNYRCLACGHSVPR
jgi:DNA-directed RNA polymerase subunit M/transcription elongation factor TFIIS